MEYLTLTEFRKKLINSLIIIPFKHDSIQKNNSRLYDYEKDTEYKAKDIFLKDFDNECYIADLIHNPDPGTKYFYISPVKGLVAIDEYIKNPPIDIDIALSQFKIHKVIAKQLNNHLSQHEIRRIIFLLPTEPVDDWLIILRIFEDFTLMDKISNMKINLFYALQQKAGEHDENRIKYHKINE